MTNGEMLERIVEAAVAQGQAPGVVAAVAHGDETYVTAAGAMAVDGPPMREDTVFRISSVTKPITAAVILGLIEDGRLSVDEPVDRLLPELAGRRVLRRPDGALDDTVAAERPITTRDLLTFTFGFGMASEMFSATAPWPVVARSEELGLSTIGPPNPDVQPDPDAWIARFGSLPLLAQPGERWLYGTGASVLGVMAARAAGKPFGEVLQTRLFEPLGMRDTAFWSSETDRLATAYVAKPEGLKVWDEPDGLWSRPPAFGDGAGGLVSSADDLLAFARMLLAGGGPVLLPESVRAMSTDQLTDAQMARGGLGPGFFAHKSWGFCQAVYDTGAFGWNGGFGTSWLVDPAHDLVVIVLTQRL